jgi:hypothetical protein
LVGITNIDSNTLLLDGLFKRACFFCFSFENIILVHNRINKRDGPPAEPDPRPNRAGDGDPTLGRIGPGAAPSPESAISLLPLFDHRIEKPTYHHPTPDPQANEDSILRSTLQQHLYAFV